MILREVLRPVLRIAPACAAEGEDYYRRFTFGCCRKVERLTCDRLPRKPAQGHRQASTARHLVARALMPPGAQPTPTCRYRHHSIAAWLVPFSAIDLWLVLCLRLLMN